MLTQLLSILVSIGRSVPVFRQGGNCMWRVFRELRFAEGSSARRARPGQESECGTGLFRVGDDAGVEGLRSTQRRINPSECYATTNFLERDFGTGIRPLTTNELAAPAGENRPTFDQTRPILLAGSGGERRLGDTRRLFRVMLRRIATLPVPAG